MGPKKLGGLFGGYSGPNVGMILGGIAGMSGANPAPYYGMGKSFDDQRRKNAMRQAWQQKLADPEFVNSLPRSVIPMLAQMDPEAGMRYATQYQLQRAGREHAAGLRRTAQNSVQYGKTGSVFQGPDGRYYTVQFASDGTRKVTPLDEGLTPSRGVSTVDTATGTRVIDKATGRDVRSIPKNLRQAEIERGAGKATAGARAGLNKQISTAERTLSTLDQLIKHPNRSWMTGTSSYLPTLPGSGTNDAEALHDQITGQAFLQAFQDLKGGGQITEQEGQKATAAIARLNIRQTDAGYLRALKELREIVKRAQARAYKSAGEEPPSGSDLSTRYPGFKIRRID